MNQIKELEQELVIAKKYNFNKREIANLERQLANQRKQQTPQKTFLQSIFSKLSR